MSDIAQTLGGVSKPKNAGPPRPPPPLPAGHHPSRAMQMTAIPKEVMDLVGGGQDPKSATLPPIVPTFAGQSRSSTQADEKSEAIIPAATTVKVGNRWISTQKPARKWLWAPFASSARTDGLLLNHWVRHGIDYPDYPYARFDIHLDPVTYTDNEYREKLQNGSWTKSETDQLLELARKYELRWPVIYDRWLELYHYQVSQENNNNSPVQIAVSRNVEDLQHRYYSVAAILMQHRIAKEAAAEAQTLAGSVPDPSAANPKAVADALLRDATAARTVAAGDPKHQPLIHNVGTGTTNKVFDYNYEKERRAQLELLWHRTKEEEVEEVNLRKELRLVEAQLRKLKKSGGHIIAANEAKTGGKTTGRGGPMVATTAGFSAGATDGTASSRDASRSASPATAADVLVTNSSGALLDQSFASTAPTPVAGTPYLQSGRLAPPATGGALGLNKTLLGRMEAVLTELKISTQPTPTKRVCDIYDSVRKDILTLLTFQKLVLQKEGQLQTKRVKLSKIGGRIQVADEEIALGIPKPKPIPPPVPTTPAASSAAAAAAAASASTKSKAPRAGGKSKGASTASGKGKAAATKAAKATSAPQVVDSKTKAPDSRAKPSDSKAKAATASVKQTGGKQTVGGKQATGGKQPRKPAAKRKRKSEAKSPAAASGPSAGATAAVLPAPAAVAYPPTVASAGARPAPAVAAPVAAAAASTAVPPAQAPVPPATSKPEAEGKASGKKRARKN